MRYFSTRMWFLYQLAMAFALGLVAPFALVRRGSGQAREILAGRLFPPPASPAPSTEPPLWLHAVSVGEAGVAATLARALPAELPLVVTTVTPTGQQRARQGLAGRATVAYLPFDLGPPVTRAFARFAPRALVMVEGDLWPLVLRAAGRRGLPRVVINGRVGDRSYRRLRRLGPFARPLLALTYGQVDAFGVQSTLDADRLRLLGVPAERITVTGNLKYETPKPPACPALAELVAGLADERPVLVAGSTMQGEEEAVLDAFAGLGNGERALLVLAPRHPERFGAVAELLSRRRFAWLARSGVPSQPPGDGARPAVLLLDTLGELAGLYRHASAAFVGGTLVPTGGHNPLEPARFGKAVAVGPSMENFLAIAEDFDRRGAWARVTSAGELAQVWRGWLDDPEQAQAVGSRALALIEENRGATERTIALLRRCGALA